MASPGTPKPPRWLRLQVGKEHPTALALLGITALVLALFRQAVFAGQVLYERDIHLYRFEQLFSLAATVRSGSWPIWDRLVSFGQPLLATSDAEVLYPTTWLSLVMTPGAAYTAFVVLHLVFSGLGAYRLAAALGVSRGGSFCAAALWITSGPLLSVVDAYHHFAGVCWLPWVVLAGVRATGRPRLRQGLWLSVALAGLVLAGSADMAVLAGLTVAIVFLGRTDWRSLSGPGNRRLAACALGSVILALGLSAAQWMPTMDLALHSARRGLPEHDRAYFSVHPLRTLETVVPIRLHELPLGPGTRKLFFEEHREPFLRSLYLGLPALALVAAAVFSHRRRLLAFLALVGGGSLLVGLGRHFVAQEMLVTLLPPLRALRYPEKALLGTAFAWSLLGGLGLDEWRSGVQGGALRWRVALPMGAALLCGFSGLWLLGQPGLLGGTIGNSLPDSPDPFLASVRLRLGLTLGLSVVALAAVFGPGGPRRQRWRIPLLVALSVGDLVIQNQSLNPTAFQRLLTYRPPYIEVVRRTPLCRLHVIDYDVAGKPERLLGRRNPYQLARHLPDWPVRVSGALAMRMLAVPPVAGGWGIEGSFEKDARGLFPPYLRELTRAALDLEETPVFSRLLRAAAVTHVVSLHELTNPGLAPVSTFPGMFVDPIRIYRVEEPLPRTYAVSGVRVADGRQAVETLLSWHFDLAREVVLTSGAESRPAPGFEGKSRIVWLGADRMRLEARLSHDGFVVLVEAYDPGWHATVDGRPARVLRANLAFRAIPVPAGEHVLELVYRPTPLRLGGSISLLALLLLGVAGWISARRTRS